MSFGMNNWQKLRQLTSQECLLLAQALVVIPLLGLGLRILGWQRLKTFLERSGGSRRPHRLPEQELDYARRAARLTNIAAGRKPLQATCLQRSAALWWLLRRQGIESGIVLGVRKGDRRLHAHAWVEYQGIVLNDRPDVRERFAAFEEM